MNQELQYQIAKHVFASLCVIKSDFIDTTQTKSILNSQYLLPEKATFNFDGKLINNNVYGCQMTLSSKQFKLLLADCSVDGFPEYCLLVQLQDSPAFGVYFDEECPEDALITVSTNNKHWMPCTTYLQGTFLAGMEQMKDIAFGWAKCTKYDEQYKMLLSLIKFHDDFSDDTWNEEEVHEGQEN